MTKRASVYPFTAIVGQERMKRALILNAIDMRIGGVLIRGERGTGKSTAARALAALLPEVNVVADSPFNDDPDQPGTWSDMVRERYERGEQLPVTQRRIRFVDLPVSATEDRVVGTLDIEKAIQRGERHFDPGVLATANRGILYVDEVNLLDDHVVDLLLDSAAMGINVVEREGISFSHPARFILVGTMNPEEGDLRPQLLDRFALSVDVTSIDAALARMDILERHIASETNAEAFGEQWAPREQELSQRIAAARETRRRGGIRPARSLRHRHPVQQPENRRPSRRPRNPQGGARPCRLPGAPAHHAGGHPAGCRAWPSRIASSAAPSPTPP